MPIHRTNLNRFVKLIEDNKLRIDRLPGMTSNGDYKYTRAISVSILEEYYKLNFQEAYGTICDGEGDCKIDALYYSDDVDDLAELVLIQAKFKNTPGETGTFSEDEIKTLAANAVAVITGREL